LKREATPLLNLPYPERPALMEGVSYCAADIP
jgi:hypothetical protein